MRKSAKEGRVVGCFRPSAHRCGYGARTPQAALIEPVETYLSWRYRLNDPDDEMVLEPAINGRADALVTDNAAHFQASTVRLGVRLARPVEILHEATSA